MTLKILKSPFAFENCQVHKSQRKWTTFETPGWHSMKSWLVQWDPLGSLYWPIIVFIELGSLCSLILVAVKVSNMQLFFWEKKNGFYPVNDEKSIQFFLFFLFLNDKNRAEKPPPLAPSVVGTTNPFPSFPDSNSPNVTGRTDLCWFHANMPTRELFFPRCFFSP